MRQLTATQLAEIREVNSFVMSRDHFGSLYEQLTYVLYYAVLRPNDFAVDCGVNVGDHSRIMARLCHPGRVFAFEAAPEMLERAKAANSGSENITYFDKALWDESGQTKTFHFFPQEHGLSGFRFRPGVSGEHVFDVETITLDDAVDSSPSLIKLDIEGAEYHALRGAERIMTECRPIIVFENGRGESAHRYDYSRDDFFALFEKRGYALYTIAGVPFVPELWEDVGCPWQFLAIHPASSRGGRALGAMNSFVSSLR